MSWEEVYEEEEVRRVFLPLRPASALSHLVGPSADCHSNGVRVREKEPRWKKQQLHLIAALHQRRRLRQECNGVHYQGNVYVVYKSRANLIKSHPKVSQRVCCQGGGANHTVQYLKNL